MSAAELEGGTTRLIAVCGHQRSGTTLLRQLLNSHPAAMITMEFRNITALDARWPRYASWVLWQKWNRDLIALSHAAPRWRRPLDGAVFVALYALGTLRRSRGHRVSLEIIRSTLHSILPWAAVVGDKYPGYVFNLDRLAARPGLLPIVITRDCRDVVASTLEKARTEWRKSRFASQIDTPEKVASRWVEAVSIQQRNEDRILSLRYEELVSRPIPVLEQLGTRLGIDPDGFQPAMVRTASIGRFRRSLSSDELNRVEAVAGDTLRRLGYR